MFAVFDLQLRMASGKRDKQKTGVLSATSLKPVLALSKLQLGLQYPVMATIFGIIMNIDDQQRFWLELSGMVSIGMGAHVAEQ